MGIFHDRPWDAFPMDDPRDDDEQGKFRTLIESGADGVLVVRPDGAICFANPAACGLLGRCLEELLNQPFGVPIVPGNITEIDIPRADGVIRVAEMRATETLWQGQPSYLASLRDITERKHEEDVLREQDRRKNEFLAMLAHELRNPLAAISNAVSIAARSPSETDRRWSLDVIGHQCGHLSRLVDDLLDVSRITRGKIELRRVLLDAVPILRQAVEAVQPLIQARNHRLDVSIPEHLWIEADPTRFEQIVVNLLTNAAKYTEENGRISLHTEQEKNEIVVRVQDNGIGIAPDSIDQMFELFAQGSRSLARSEGGLGIGLTLVKALVELHGGTIAARSQGTDRGSEFTVRMPAAQPPPILRDGAGAPSRHGEKFPTTRVLVVDDFVIAAKGLAKIMELHGHEVSMAHDGPSAIAQALAFRPQVILLDIGLPGMDGYQVAQRLRKESSLQGCRLIAVSGYGQEADRMKSLAAGIDHHLIKPVDITALLNLVENNL